MSLMEFAALYEQYKTLFRIIIGCIVLLVILIMSTMMQSYQKQAEDQQLAPIIETVPDKDVHSRAEEVFGKKKKEKKKPRGAEQDIPLPKPQVNASPQEEPALQESSREPATP